MKALRSPYITPLLGALFMAVLLYKGGYEHLVSVGGGDPAAHLEIAWKLAKGQWDVYERATSFHAAVLILVRWLGFEVFSAVRLVLVMAALAIGALTFRPAQLRALPLISAFLFVFWVTGPIVHYYQADGFYGQFAAFAVLLAGVTLTQRALNLRAQLITAALAVVVLRFTYPLNLPDFLAGLALLFGERAWFHRKQKVRLALAAVAAGLALASVYGYFKLAPMLTIRGSTRVQRTDYLTFGSWICLIALSTRPRLSRLGWNIALINTVWMTVLIVFNIPRDYFFFKYPAAATLVLGLEWVHAQNTKLAHWRQTALFVGLFCLAIGYGAYFGKFWIRVHPSPSAAPVETKLEAIGDPITVRWIEARLKAEHATLISFYCPFTPRCEFAEYSIRIRQTLGQLPPLEAPQRCEFWDAAMPHPQNVKCETVLDQPRPGSAGGSTQRCWRCSP